MEIKEIVKMAAFVLLLIIMVGAVTVLLSEKGIDTLNFLKDLMRFGR